MAYLLLPGLAAALLAAHLYRSGELALAGARGAEDRGRITVRAARRDPAPAVAAFTVAAALVFRNGRVRVRYDIGGRF